MDRNLILMIAVGVWALGVLIVLFIQEKQIFNLKKDYEAVARSHTLLIDLAEAARKHSHDQDERINDLDTATEKYFETLQKMNNDLATRVDKLQEDLGLTDRVSEAVSKEITDIKDALCENKNSIDYLNDFVHGIIDSEKSMLIRQNVLEDRINSMVLPYQDDDKKPAECNSSYSIVKEDDDRQNDMKAISDELHYVKVPENHIVIDLDLRSGDGEKSAERNIEAASKWPSTYAEYSKDGSGVHLNYIYDGDIDKLSRIYYEGMDISKEEVVADATTV